MRAALVLVIVGCAHGPPYKLSVTEKYEVGEDATIALRVRQLSDDDAQIIVTRPDGSIVKENAPLDVESSRIRFGRPAPHPGLPPTFTVTGAYQIELRVDDKVVATTELMISNARLDELLPMEDIAGYKQITRYTRAKLNGKRQQWKTYGAIYTLPRKVEARVAIIIEEPKRHLEDAWRAYREEGTVSVIEGNNVVFRERAESVSASWISGDKIIGMRAPTLADLEKGIIGHFLTKFPSKLEAK